MGKSVSAPNYFGRFMEHSIGFIKKVMGCTDMEDKGSSCHQL